ncbi:TOMM precursor leader peptide-binding protein [Streptomyces sp. NPDC014734]|uniref:TOMM precursor leader peptide-binding protein n=1 Tax=Streptomyces sp. NPDC014734 TaxID=3364886 RepID=UPI0036FE2307
MSVEHKKYGESRLRRSYSVIGHSPDVVEIRTGVWNHRSFTLTDERASGKLYALVRGLDGSLSHRELASQVGVPRAEVEAVVDHLATLDALEWSPHSALDAYLETIGPLRTADAGTTSYKRVFVLGDPVLAEHLAASISEAGDVKAEVLGTQSPVAQALSRAGADTLNDGLRLAELVRSVEELRGSVLVTVDAVVNPFRSQLINRVTQELGVPWLHTGVDGPFLFIGPTVIPGRSACYECFETRVGMNIRESASYQRYKEALATGQVRTGEPALLSAMRTTLVGHAALEAINLLAAGSTFSVGKVLGIYVPTMEIAWSDVLKLPGCRGCSSLAGRDDTHLYFDVRTWAGE